MAIRWPRMARRRCGRSWSVPRHSAAAGVVVAAAPAAAVVVAAVLVAAVLAGCGSSHPSSASHSATTSRSGSGAAPGSGAASGSGATSGSRTPSGTSGAAPPTSTRHGALAVVPRRGRPATTFHLSFRAPDSGGAHAGLDHAYALSVLGSRGSGCVSTHEQIVPVTTQGQTVTVAVGPAQLHGDWCRGAYVARVSEEVRPVCKTGQVCPQFVRIAAILGPVRFTVAG